MHIKGQMLRKLILIALAIVFMLLSISPGITHIEKPISFKHATSLTYCFSDVSPLLSRYNIDKKLAKGMFLVASENIRDPLFAKTVILLIDYSYRGAMGLIVNKPTEIKLSKIFPEIKGLEQKLYYVYIGGPVSINHVFLLIQSGSQPEGSVMVFDNIYVSSNKTLLMRTFENLKAEERFRLYAGYAGWASGQLDWEIARGDWHIMRADAEVIFDKAPLDVWQRLMFKNTTI
jgi:putative transcriptional regulator